MKPRFRWYAVAQGQRLPRTRSMVTRSFGWDVVCECGWDSSTGGAIRASVQREIKTHLLLDHSEIKH